MKPIIAISMGDPAGVGPEIIIKSLIETGTDYSTPLLLGSEAVFRYYANTLSQEIKLNIIDDPTDVKQDAINLVNCSDLIKGDIKPGNLTAVYGRVAMEAVAAGVDYCLQEKADALVTAPISKEAITLAGYSVPGHTEFLAEKTRAEEVLMMLISGSFRVALATIHIPLVDVPGQVTASNLKSRLRILNQSLKEDFGIEKPSIAVFGLNPHAGDGGVIGREEANIIKPVIEDLRQDEIYVQGPFAADGFFGMRRQDNFDAIFAMYHDQGLVPFKALTFGKGVNFTAGLPIIRTSPDHGTAFDIAGKNAADHGSFTAAYRLAEQLAMNKNQKN